MLRESGGSIVTAFSGSETTEIAYALGRLLRSRPRRALGRSPGGDVGRRSSAFRLPLSAIAEAELVVVIGDDPVVERAPIVDLWIKEARRHGAEVVVVLADGHEQAAPGSGAEICRELASGRSGAREEAARGGASRPDLVGAGRRRRRPDRGARARARLRREARLRRVPSACRGEPRTASRSAGRSQPTRTRRTPSRSSSSSSRVTRRRATRTSARSPSRRIASSS